MVRMSLMITKSLSVSLVAALFAGVALPAAAEDAPAPAATTQSLPAIVVTPVVKRKLVDRIIASGTIRAVEDVFVQPLVEGLSIRSLGADVGDSVTEGQVLAELNTDQLELAKAQAEATRAKAEAGLAQAEASRVEASANADEAVRQRDRAIKLGKQGTFSEAQVEQQTTAAATALARVSSAEQAVALARADIKVAESQLADIALKLKRTSVVAPVAGLVSARTAKVGAIASGAGEPLFTVIANGDLELVADVSESDILKLKVGQAAQIRLAGSDRALTGSVRLISPTIDATTRLGAVHVALDDDAAARAGMYGSADITVETADGLALPLTAVTTGDDGATARKVQDGVVRLVPVKTGIEDGGFVQIAEGLAEGDEVVAKAGAYVRDGDRVSPLRETAKATN